MFAYYMCNMVGLSTILVESCGQLGGQCSQSYPEKPIFDIPGFYQVRGRDLVEGLYDQMKRFPLNVMLNTSIDKIANAEDSFKVQTSNGELQTSSIILSTGDGLLKPNRPMLKNTYELERAGYIQYYMNDLAQFKDKVVAIGGGGDSALDWALTLSPIASKIYIIHRRNSFRAMDSLQKELGQLVKEGKCEVLMPTEIQEIVPAEGMITLKLSHDTEIQAHYFIPCYGNQSDKNLMAGINAAQDNHSRIKVDPATCQSSLPGLYAVGDANAYEHKRKLIVCGFGEATNAAYHIRETRGKGEFVFEYSTSKFSD